MYAHALCRWVNVGLGARGTGEGDKNTSSGWRKKATRGCYSHEWDDDASRGPTPDRAATNDATDKKAANCTGDVATEKEAVKRR